MPYSYNKHKDTIMELELNVEVKEKNIGGWYLVLTNTLTQKSFELDTILELDEKMETLAALYPERTPKVIWLETPDVRDEYVNEVRQQLLAYSDEANTTN